MDETWYTDVTSQEDDKKVIKSGGHRARFDVTMLRNTTILDPLSKTARSPKLDKTRDFFDDACGIPQNLILLYCLHRDITFNNSTH